MSITVWRCAECGFIHSYEDTATHHGGPETRGLDSRYSLRYTCWNKACPSRKRVLRLGRTILIADSAPNPREEEQPDLDNINRIIQEGKGRKKKRG